MSGWWIDHPFTTAVVTGLLVLLVTVLIADRVIERRRLKERSRGIAAQAALVYAQAARACEAVRPLLESDSVADEDAEGEATEQVRTYALIVMIAVPTLIDASSTRTFLETAQGLGTELGAALTRHRRGESGAQLADRIDAGLSTLREVARPLADLLDPRLRAAVEGQDVASDAADSL
jgi:hypothetical protein